MSRNAAVAVNVCCEFGQIQNKTKTCRWRCNRRLQMKQSSFFSFFSINVLVLGQFDKLDDGGWCVSGWHRMDPSYSMKCDSAQCQQSSNSQNASMGKSHAENVFSLFLFSLFIYLFLRFFVGTLSSFLLRLLILRIILLTLTTTAGCQAVALFIVGG